MKFNSMFGAGVSKTGIDLSREEEEVFTEIPPFAIDDKGKILNKSDKPVIIANGKINVQEKIQSFASDCDLYKILEKVAFTGDESYLQQRIGSFTDIIDLPDNVNDMNEYVRRVTNTEGISNEVLEAAIKDNLTSEDMQKLINEAVAKAMAENQQKSEVVDNANN